MPTDPPDYCAVDLQELEAIHHLPRREDFGKISIAPPISSPMARKPRAADVLRVGRKRKVRQYERLSTSPTWDSTRPARYTVKWRWQTPGVSHHTVQRVDIESAVTHIDTTHRRET
jgi:hypothetical protein